MLRNKHIIAIFAILFSLFGQAQKRHPSGLNLRGADEEAWNFGILLHSDFIGISYELQNESEKDNSAVLSRMHTTSTSPGLRLLAEYTIAENLSLRFEPGYLYNKPFFGRKKSDSNETIGVSEFQVPILLKYQSHRINNYNPFIIFGASPTIQRLKKEEILNISELTDIFYRRITYSLEFGFGVDFYLKKSKLGLHLRGINQLPNYEIQNDVPVIKGLNWNGFLIGISFETKDGWKLYAR